MSEREAVRNKLLRLMADNDQDRAGCQQWWQEASNAEKLAVWNVIQTDYTDPTMELMSRFAQLAFSEMAVQEARNQL
jgi:hypothetical protein